MANVYLDSPRPTFTLPRRLHHLIEDVKDHMDGMRRRRAVSHTLAGLTDAQLDDIGVHRSELTLPGEPKTVFDPLSREMRRVRW